MFAKCLFYILQDILFVSIIFLLNFSFSASFSASIRRTITIDSERDRETIIMDKWYNKAYFKNNNNMNVFRKSTNISQLHEDYFYQFYYGKLNNEKL